jgi:1,4-dihydroxy-2-naphthoate octaprenyltransferase
MSPRFGLRRRTAVGPAAAGLTEPSPPAAADSVEPVSMEAFEPKVVWPAHRRDTLGPDDADAAEPTDVAPGDKADEAPADEAPAGEAPAGEAPAGEAPAGEAPAGEAPAGEAPAGEAPVGEAPLGDGADAAGLVELSEYGRAVLSWVAADAYPVNVDVEIEVKLGEGVVRFSEPPGFKVAAGSIVAITGSHVHPLPGGGFDERRHVTVWGVATARPRGRFVVKPDRVWAWDELDLPLPAAYERSLPRARRYFEALSAERGVQVRPRLSTGLLLFRVTRSPFLSATFVPVLLGLAVAARTGFFDALTALITLLAAGAVHLGLNVANDVFDTLQGADDANPTPTKFSGGFGVLQNALVTIREMSILALGCYAVAAALGLLLMLMRGSTALLVLSVLGLFISVAYKMPPFKLVYRGLGEIAVAIGFGPLLVLGAYTVQSRGSISLEAYLVALPAALLVGMIPYVNEIPDRADDAQAGKRTLPVRWTRETVIPVFDMAAAVSFVAVVASVAAGLLPLPGLLVLVAIPLAIRVHVGLVSFYDSPYALMETMATNIQLHLSVGVLLLVGYLLAIADQTFLGLKPFLW